MLECFTVKAFLADLLICAQATLNSLRRVRERWRDSRACLALHRSRREMLLQLLTYHSDSITLRMRLATCSGFSTLGSFTSMKPSPSTLFRGNPRYDSISLKSLWADSK